MSEMPAADESGSSIPAESVPDEAPNHSPDLDEVVAADRLFGAFALGVMALLVICVVLAFVASRNVPAGL